MAQAGIPRYLALALALLLIVAPLSFHLVQGQGFGQLEWRGGSAMGAVLLGLALALGGAALLRAPRQLGALAAMIAALFVAVGVAARFGPGVPDHIFFVVYVFAPILFALAALALAGRIDAYGWLKRGAIDQRMKLVLAILAVASTLVLLGYFRTLRPDLTHQPLMRSTSIPVALLAIGLGIAALNSFIEEAIYRGILYDGLERTGIAAWGVVAIQALAFGTFHLNSNEPGLAGVIITCVLGLVLGILRKVSGGLLAPFCLHFVLDIGVWSLGMSQVLGWNL